MKSSKKNAFDALKAYICMTMRRHGSEDNSMTTVQLDTWDNSIPVVLPYGERTMDGVISASMGVCVPFTLFILFVFNFLYNKHFKASFSELQDTVRDCQVSSVTQQMVYSDFTGANNASISVEAIRPPNNVGWRYYAGTRYF